MGDIQRGQQTQQQVAEVPPDSCFQSVSAVGTTKTEISFGGTSSTILIENTHASQELKAYFRSSPSAWNNAYKTIVAGGNLSIGHRATGVKIVGQGAGTTYEMLVTLE